MKLQIITDRLSPAVRDVAEELRAVVRDGFPWWLRPFVERNVVGIAFGRAVYVGRHSEGGIYLDRLVRHELTHLRQMREEGITRFLYLYFSSYIHLRAEGLSHDAAYLAIPFEVEARREEMEVVARAS